MKINATAEDFIKGIVEILRREPRESSGIFIFNFESMNLEIKLADIENLIKSLISKEEIDETAIYDEKSLEILVKEESSYPGYISFRIRDPGQKIEKYDADNDIKYTISRPSDEYLLFLICKLSNLHALRSMWPLNMRSRLSHATNPEDIGNSIFDVLRFAPPRLLTLRLESTSIKTVHEFKKFADAFLFQISYNLDSSIVTQRYLDEVVRAGRIRRIRRSDIDEIEVPKRFFVPELLYHYQMAVASDSPLLEYLSYYHIAEYFFENVFSDDLIERIRNKITQPDFSYKRKKDINQLIKEINKSCKLRGENTTFSEQEAFRLTLERYVKLDDLIVKIKDYDESLIKYYKEIPVSFSGGDRIDFENNDSKAILKFISFRIYKTRNSIVHSKESDKERYIPFEHDAILVKEVPLLRFIAELIIIETSTIIT